MTHITEKDRARALRCVNCLACKQARRKQRGFFFWIVKTVERKMCPFCRAYEKVYGRKAHEKPRAQEV
jgi:uncharacterized protein CbrC (UPF0167 family)